MNSDVFVGNETADGHLPESGEGQVKSDFRVIVNQEDAERERQKSEDTEQNGRDRSEPGQ